jgi:putative hydrolase of the HAD superfamily
MEERITPARTQKTMPVPRPECLFIDLDDTLYPPDRGIWGEISRRINLYLSDRIGVPIHAVDAERRRLFERYGTTFSGLQHEHAVNPEEYFTFVHDIPLDRFLTADAALRDMLARLPQRKFVFSNADAPYIRRVLEALGVLDLFDGIIDIYATGFACKPLPASYQAALTQANQSDAARCWLVDDLARNLVPAAQLGMVTVLVAPKERTGNAHHQIDHIHELEKLLREETA